MRNTGINIIFLWFMLSSISISYTHERVERQTKSRKQPCPPNKFLNTLGDCHTCNLCNDPGFVTKESGCQTCRKCPEGQFFHPHVKECHSCVACVAIKSPIIRKSNGCKQCTQGTSIPTLQPTMGIQTTTVSNEPKSDNQQSATKHEGSANDKLVKGHDNVNLQASHPDGIIGASVTLSLVLTGEVLLIFVLVTLLIVAITKCTKQHTNTGYTRPDKPIYNKVNAVDPVHGKEDTHIHGRIDIIHSPIQDGHPPGDAPDDCHIHNDLQCAQLCDKVTTV
ncbi:uncharacterized protein LOC144438326 isoform X1 [Glandiceps talaboti]